MKVYTVMLNRGDYEGDRLVGIFDSVATAEAFIEVQDYPSWHDWYSWDVETLSDIGEAV
jgi:hypothetical membrane protein